MLDNMMNHLAILAKRIKTVDLDEVQFRARNYVKMVQLVRNSGAITKKQHEIIISALTMVVMAEITRRAENR